MRNVQVESSTLKSMMESEDMRMLQRFKADPHLRTFTLGTWANARHDMVMVSKLRFMCTHILTVFFSLPTRLRSFYVRTPSTNIRSEIERL